MVLSVQDCFYDSKHIISTDSHQNSEQYFEKQTNDKIEEKYQCITYLLNT